MTPIERRDHPSVFSLPLPPVYEEQGSFYLRQCNISTIKSLIRQQNKYFLEYIDYVFRPVNRSSSGHQSNKSKVLLRYWDPNIYKYI